MADEEQLAILKQGVEVWNRWRKDNPEVKIDLLKANLARADLTEANLNGADLSGASLGGANLERADLVQASLEGAFLVRADLRGADLSGANLAFANLSGVFFGGAKLSEASIMLALLIEADLTGADLAGTNLYAAILRRANLTGCNVSRAGLTETTIADIDLSQTVGLEQVRHGGPSSISTDTFIESKGQIPQAFLRGCGLSDWEIELVKLYNPDLTNAERNKILYKVYDLQATQALQISPLFISYSHADNEFVDKVGNCLQDKGVRYWRDMHEMKAGRIEAQIDRGIRQNPTVLLVLSEHSIKSDWVEHEVRTARLLEKEIRRDILCPVALDDSWKDSRWPKRVMEQIMEYNILDFSEWEDDNKFDGMFRKLIDGLELFYKG